MLFLYTQPRIRTVHLHMQCMHMPSLRSLSASRSLSEHVTETTWPGRHACHAHAMPHARIECARSKREDVCVLSMCALAPLGGRGTWAHASWVTAQMRGEGCRVAAQADASARSAPGPPLICIRRPGPKLVRSGYTRAHPPLRGPAPRLKLASRVASRCPPAHARC
jgi:hypothetical protein